MDQNKKNIESPLNCDTEQSWEIGNPEQSGLQPAACSLGLMRSAHFSARFRNELCTGPDLYGHPDAAGSDTSLEQDWLNWTGNPFSAGCPKEEPALLSRSKNLLHGLKDGSCDDCTASQSWKELLKGIENQQKAGFTGWNDEHRAELFKTLTELRGYGCRVTIPRLLRQRPANPAAVKFWREAQRNLEIQLTP